jgi:hypothetical protein
MKDDFGCRLFHYILFSRAFLTWFYSVIGTTSDRSTTGFSLLAMAGTLSMVGTVPLFSPLTSQKKTFRERLHYIHTWCVKKQMRRAT